MKGRSTGMFRRFLGQTERKIELTRKAIIILILAFFGGGVTVEAATYYVSPTGNDSASGTSQSTPWATFNRSWQSLQPGDTLLLMDGTYYQSIAPNVRDGAPNPAININDYQTYPLDHPERIKNYIKVKAINDGKAIIDGQGARIPVSSGYAPNGWWVGSYYVIEGVVAKNSSESVFVIENSNVVIRRCSGYNANINGNDHVFLLYGYNNLLEDCIAAGSGRKMILIIGAGAGGGSSIVRRCFAAWQAWKGANFCPGPWPWGDTIESYNSSNNIIENSIGYGKAPLNGINVFAQSGATAANNKVLGSVMIKSGMNWDGSQEVWPCPSPYNSGCPSCADFSSNDALRMGFHLGNADGSYVTDNLFQDVFAWGNGGLGFNVSLRPIGSTNMNNRLVRATLLNNGVGNPIYAYIQNKSMTSEQRQLLSEIADSKIDGVAYNGGGGARLIYRYVDGKLMDGTNGQPAQQLWPWPMESRIKDEFAQELGVSNFSVTQAICEQTLKPNGAVTSCGFPSDSQPPAVPKNLTLQIQ